MLGSGLKAVDAQRGNGSAGTGSGAGPTWKAELARLAGEAALERWVASAHAVIWIVLVALIVAAILVDDLPDRRRDFRPSADDHVRRTMRLVDERQRDRGPLRSSERNG